VFKPQMALARNGQVVDFLDSLQYRIPEGLCVGLLYTQQIRLRMQVLVPSHQRSMLPLVPLTTSTELSAEEWKWLQTLPFQNPQQSLEDLRPSPDASPQLQAFQQLLQGAIKELSSICHLKQPICGKHLFASNPVFLEQLPSSCRQSPASITISVMPRSAEDSVQDSETVVPAAVAPDDSRSQERMKSTSMLLFVVNATDFSENHGEEKVELSQNLCLLPFAVFEPLCSCANSAGRKQATDASSKVLAVGESTSEHTNSKWLSSALSRLLHHKKNANPKIDAEDSLPATCGKLAELEPVSHAEQGILSTDSCSKSAIPSQIRKPAPAARMSSVFTMPPFSE